MSSMRHAGGVLKNRIMNEEKERPRYHPPSAELRGKQKETPKESANADPTGQVREKLESEGLDPDEFDENEREELANPF